MRRYLLALLFLATPLQAASQTLTVLQWNTYHGGRGTDSRSDVARQVNWIAAKHPDIVTLNEVMVAQAEEYRAGARSAGDLNAGPNAGELQPILTRMGDAWPKPSSGTARPRIRTTRRASRPPRAGTGSTTLHSAGLVTVQAEIPDQRDWSTGRPAIDVGTRDDEAVRPSDHDFVFAVLRFDRDRR